MDDTATYYAEDHISAVDARFEAQKIAFGPFSFQAAYAMQKLGMLSSLLEAGESGLDASGLASKCGVSSYGVSLLMQMALGLGICKSTTDGRYTLGKIGYFLADDYLTKVNMDFMQDVCYEGAAYLTDSIKSGKPEGLKAFGEQWNTVYEALSSLPEQAKKSWFAFDHNYSDHIFPESLPLVFAHQTKKLYDVGGNTAKWALSCVRYDENVDITIVDLPGQTAVAERNAKAAGFADRIHTIATNILDFSLPFPTGADTIWMSQFLDCFSLDEITAIISKISRAVTSETRIYVLEPLIDRQRFRASSFCLQETSLYFTCIANGNSRMYCYEELVGAIEKGGVRLAEAHHNLGVFSYTLLCFKRA